MDEVKISLFNLLLTRTGLPLFLLDIVLDVLASVDFYKEEAYVCLGVLLLLLIGSSFLTQIFSWLWYKYDDSEMETEIEKCMQTLHFLQLGVFVRHETSVKSFRKGDKLTDKAESLNDLPLLKLFETFSESAPQIVLMFTVILQRGQLDLITVLKTLVSMSAVALGVTSYHRSLRASLTDKANLSIVSSLMHLFWNLLLLLSRLVALSLFASVQPCYIFAHFISSWLLLFFCAWRVKSHLKTDFMDSVSGEWLYRATVGLIWYFDWFSAVEGKTRNKTLLYHSYILADISVLVGVWCWKMSTDPPYFVVPPLYAAITAASVVTVYILGLFFKVIYYKFFHPNSERRWRCWRGRRRRRMANCHELEACEVFHFEPMLPSSTGGDATGGDISGGDATKGKKRMKKLAENFYS